MPPVGQVVPLHEAIGRQEDIRESCCRRHELFDDEDGFHGSKRPVVLLISAA